MFLQFIVQKIFKKQLFYIAATTTLNFSLFFFFIENCSSIRKTTKCIFRHFCNRKL